MFVKKVLFSKVKRMSKNNDFHTLVIAKKRLPFYIQRFSMCNWILESSAYKANVCLAFYIPPFFAVDPLVLTPVYYIYIYDFTRPCPLDVDWQTDTKHVTGRSTLSSYFNTSNTFCWQLETEGLIFKGTSQACNCTILCRWGIFSATRAYQGNVANRFR